MTRSGMAGESAPNAGWEGLARAAAARAPAEPEEDLPRELLTFLLAGVPYALPIERVREIVRLRKLTPIPRVPPQVLGAIALRGEILQIVDLRVRLGVESCAPTRASRIIVLFGDEEQLTGLLVDQVQQVLRVPESQVGAPPGSQGPVAALCARADEFVSILDPDRLLDFGGDD